jgi:hypothetical protein
MLPLKVDGQMMGTMGNPRRPENLEIGLYRGGLERTTGFEPATLTLAKRKRIWSAESAALR